MRHSDQALAPLSFLIFLFGWIHGDGRADEHLDRSIFLRTYCVKCHGPEDAEAGVRLDNLPQAATTLETAERWDAVLEVLQTEYMPPAEEAAIPSEDRLRIVAEIRSLLRDGLAAQNSLPHTPIRRMNRFQYNNAVVDLLELKVDLFALPERMMREHGRYFDPASGKMPPSVQVGSRPLGKSQLVQKRLAGVAPFPQDLRAEHGFDNRGDHLSLSPLLMEAFLKLSRSVVNSRDFGPQTCGAWNRLFAPPPAGSDLAEVVNTRLSTLLTTAFRRPVSDDVLRPYVTHVLDQIDSEQSFADAMKEATSAVLASPRFLYLYDRRDASALETSPQYDLASRLSFFLWGSLPDAELLRLAAESSLSETAVLEAQVERMLSDRRLKRFCDSFPAQWLQLEQIISAQPDEAKFPGFYRGRYRASMHMMAEPLLLFETILIENRSVLELIDPPFSYRSALLQSWLATGKASNFRPTVMKFDRVENRDRREGGVITNPAIMTMTAGPQRSKPITRGAWMATVIFNDPPQPPPADVPPLPEASDADTEKLTLRERLNMHRQRADCKGCHAKIDPLGSALENYGPTGTWREAYDNGREVDSSGVLFRRHRFSNPVEFKDAILAEKNRFVRAFAKHLLAFALGRETGVADSPALDEIVRRTIDDDYRMQTLITQIILSRPFLQCSRGSDPSEPPLDPSSSRSQRVK